MVGIQPHLDSGLSVPSTWVVSVSDINDPLLVVGMRVCERVGCGVSSVKASLLAFEWASVFEMGAADVGGAKTGRDMGRDGETLLLVCAKVNVGA